MLNHMGMSKMKKTFGVRYESVSSIERMQICTLHRPKIVAMKVIGSVKKKGLPVLPKS